jgi:transposase
MYPDLKIKGQNISDLLERMGSHGVHEEFMDRLAGKENGGALVFDITSLSSYSRQIGLLEYGYNREGESLEQVNLGLVVDKKKGIPLMYDLYPGSIVDVLTLVNTLKRVRAHGIHDYTLVLDRGFFSRNNVIEMVREKASFIIPGSGTLKIVKEIIQGCKEIRDPCYLQKYNGKPLFVKPVHVDIEGVGLGGYLYYNPGREQAEKESFLGRLYDVRSKLLEKKLQSWMNPEDVFEDIAGNMKPFFSCKIEGDHFHVEVRNNAVSMRLNRMGGSSCYTTT